MVRVDRLTKWFGGRSALRGISFEARPREVTALLGPNGAGKTTTLRIITGFLAASSGEAVVAGWPVQTHPREVKRNIGYLPEGVPLYPDMRVTEYLWHRAGLRGLDRPHRQSAVAEVIERCQLGDRRRQIIGTLSRGYRQRVGLADALLGRPPVLILDEPTGGLDPNQLRQMRTLITELGRDHAVLLSTHILSEVEATAARVVVLREGTVAVADTTESLRRRFGALEQAFAAMTVEGRAGEPEGDRGAERDREDDGERESADGGAPTART